MCFDKAVTGISKAASELEVGYGLCSSGPHGQPGGHQARAGMVLCRSQASLPVLSRTD